MNQQQNKISGEELETQEAIKQLALARMQAIPKDVKISIGSDEYSKEELINQMKNKSEIGKQLIEMQINFVRDMAQGKIYQTGDE